MVSGPTPFAYSTRGALLSIVNLEITTSSCGYIVEGQDAEIEINWLV